MDFMLTSEYMPTGDQPEAIRELAQGVEEGLKHQTLLGQCDPGSETPYPDPFTQ